MSVSGDNEDTTRQRSLLASRMDHGSEACGGVMHAACRRGQVPLTRPRGGSTSEI